MERLGDIIDKEDGKCFREDYYDHRSRFLFLISKTQISDKPQIEKIDIVPYEKLETLIQYLENRDYDHRGPLRGRDLKINGFPEILEGFNMPIKRYDNEPCLTFNDNEIVNAQKLINKLVQLESYNALLPYFDNDKKRIYIIEGPGRTDMSNCILEQHSKATTIYTEFIRLAKELENNPHIKLEIIDDNPNVFFSTAYVTFARRPYLCFNQSKSATILFNRRSQPRYRIDENLDLQDYYGPEFNSKSYPSMSSMFDEMFSYPKDFNSNKLRIIEIFNSIFNDNRDDIEVYYDWVKECYCFSRDVEDLIFAKYPIQSAKSPYFCKYTSLNTILCILNSGKMRLNSIATMNDPTETQKLYSEGCNFICDGETPDDAKKWANNYYLTSFTCSKDGKFEEDLNMWRFYGDDAKGVCLVFEPLIEDHQVFEVKYDDLRATELMKIETFMTALKDEGIRFCIQSFVEKYLFIKPKEYQTEKESRIIKATIDQPEYTVYSNNIVTPFIERTLTYNKSEVDPSCDTTFPLKLTRIILGPEMKNKDINKLNLESMIQSKRIFKNNVIVDISKLKCYRQ